MSITDALGDREATLIALRARLAALIDDPETPTREVAALTLRMTDVLSQIADLPAAKKGSAADDLAARRASRHSNAQASQRAAE